MSLVNSLLSAAEFSRHASVGPQAELVCGIVVPCVIETPRHGEICGRLATLLFPIVKMHGFGRVATNNAGIITEHNPDTVRGADVAYYSYNRVPKGPLPASYLEVAPELAFEVLSPDDRWPRLLQKIGEYLSAGVLAVCVLDPASETAQIFRAEQPAETFTADDELEFPEALPGFRVRVGEFFE